MLRLCNKHSFEVKSSKNNTTLGQHHHDLTGEYVSEDDEDPRSRIKNHRTEKEQGELFRSKTIE